MANNGFLIGDSCLSIKEKSIQICKQSNPLFSWAIPHYRYDSAISEKIMCSAASGVATPSVWLSYPAFECEIPGAPLTETQQIEAINALFPSAIAILVIAWGFKYIRVLVAEWLKERNASD